MRASLVLAAVTACGHAAAPPPSNVAPRSGPPPVAPECAPTTEAAQRALYTTATGKPYVTSQQGFYEQTCLGASTTFPGLLTVGVFGTEVDWQHADSARRGTLALAWVTEVEYFDPMQTKPADTAWPEDATFTAPAARADASGGITVAFWIAMPRMDPGLTVREMEIAVSPDGVPGGPSVEYEATRDDGQP